MAAERQSPPPFQMVVRGDQALIGLMEREGSAEITRYFTHEDEADAAVTDDNIRAALSVVGAWSDLDWDETEAALDRLRHESRPTPPIEL